MPKPSPPQVHAEALDDYRWLIGSAADAWLQWAGTSTLPLTAKVAYLRARLTPEQTHRVLEQIELREKARTKFAAAGRMFFTSRALEQATDEIVAAHKAARFSASGRMFDLCCGVGGDLLALARRGETVGFDRDPIMATIAEANARLLLGETTAAEGRKRCPEVHVRDVSTLDVGECDAWHIDPDRRPSGRRTTRVDLHEPSTEVIEHLLAQNTDAAIKLAPAARMPAAWSERAELEWISRGRECRQLVAWFGDLARDASHRRATVLGPAAAETRSFTGTPHLEPPLADRVGRYVLEPDAAVLAAKLDGALAAQHGLAAIAPGIAYWTGEQAIADPALGCFEVQEVLPFRLKPLRTLLRARGIGQLEIKKRGVAHDPAELRVQLDLAGENSATLLLVPIEKRVTAILARRIQAL
jgi:SAM-dependent methyltransferase